MCNRVENFLNDFPFLVGMDKGVYVVGGTARYLVGACDAYPKDIDIRCPDKDTFFAIVDHLQGDTDLTGSMSNSCQGLFDGMLVDVWLWSKSPEIASYVRNVPLSRDGIAVRFSGDREMLTITSPDFWGPVTQRCHPGVIKTRSFQKHVSEGLLHV